MSSITLEHSIDEFLCNLPTSSLTNSTMFGDPIMFLEHATDAVPSNRVLMIVRNMAGEDVCFAAVKKTGIFADALWHVSQKLGYEYGFAHLLVNYQKPDATDSIMGLIPELEATGHVVHLLVSENPHRFVCPNCHHHRYVWKCMYWSEDPSDRCDHLMPSHFHVCCEGDGEESDEFEMVEDAE